jgi:hypothetical protein
MAKISLDKSIIFGNTIEYSEKKRRAGFRA